MIKRISLLITAALLVLALAAPVALAAPLADNCTRTNGTVTCTEGPGNNQAGVGNETDTQGNTKNLSPDERGGKNLGCDVQNPQSAKGDPITCP